MSSIQYDFTQKRVQQELGHIYIDDLDGYSFEELIEFLQDKKDGYYKRYKEDGGLITEPHKRYLDGASSKKCKV